MIAALSTPVRRLVALSLLILLPGAAYVLLVAPLLEHYETQQLRISDLRDQAARYQRIAGEAPALERQLAALRQASRSADGYLVAANETLAGAQLQARLKSIVEQAGGSIRSSQPLPPRQDASLVRITVRVHATHRLDSLVQVVAAITGEAQVLTIDHMHVRARSAAANTPSSDAQAPLDVRLDVSGFMRGRTR